jgi:hypothetical protein
MLLVSPLIVECGICISICCLEEGFEVEVCTVFGRRADSEAKVSVTQMVSVLVLVHLKLRPWWSAARLSFAHQQDTHTKGRIFLQITNVLFLSGGMLLGIRRIFIQKGVKCIRVCHDV